MQLAKLRPHSKRSVLYIIGRHFWPESQQRIRSARALFRLQHERTEEDGEMISAPARKAAIFVDRSCTEHWIVCDPEGNYWILPPVENAWDGRRPFAPTDKTKLEPVPAHYRFLLNLPF
jgi:hypothetical protein